MGQISEGRVTGILPRVKDLSGMVSTVLMGTAAFIGSNGIGKLVDNLLAQLNLTGSMGKAAGVVKFGGRVLIAHAAASTFFKARRGPLSAANGRFLLNLTIITGGVALLRDLGVVDMLPAQVQPLIPQLSGYDSGVSRTSLSRYHRRRHMRGYDSGVRRTSLSAYDNGVHAASLSHANYDTMPVETMEQPTYGVPFGA